MMKTMKQTLSLFLAAAIITLVGVGCAKPQPTPQPPVSSTSSSAPAASGTTNFDLAAPLVISYSHVQSTASPTHQAMAWLDGWLREQSQDKVSLEIFPAGQLYNDATEIDACVGGNIDMISTYMSKLTSIDTTMQYCLAPFLFEDPEQMQAFYLSVQAKPLFAKLNDMGMEVVEVQFGGNQYFWSSKQALTEPATFNGIKLREGGGAMSEALYSALGASLTTVPYNDLYTAMQTKLVDACVISVDAGVPIQLQETVTSVVSYGHQYAPYLIMFNKDTWASYPENVQRLLREGLALAREKQMEIALQAVDTGLETIKATCEYHVASDEAVAALKGIWDPVTTKFVSQQWMDAIAQFKAA